MCFSEHAIFFIMYLKFMYFCSLFVYKSEFIINSFLFAVLISVIASSLAPMRNLATVQLSSK